MSEAGDPPVPVAPTDPTPPPADKVLTQADVDRIVQERLTRERQKFADYEDLKSKASKLDELEQANKSELEKMQARAEEAEKRATEASERAKASTLRAAIVDQANRAGAVDADAVLALLDPNAVTIGDDGQVTGAEEAVAKLLESKPYLVGKTPGVQGAADGGPRGSGGGPKQLSRDDLTGMTPEAIEAAWRSGQLADVTTSR